MSARHTLERTIPQAVDACYGGYIAKAVKRGRQPSRPYVPVIEYPSPRYGRATSQIPSRAFATREEAVGCAQSQIDRLRAKLGDQLADPTMRAARAQWGVPDSACSDPAYAERLNLLFGRESIASIANAGGQA